MKNQITAVLLLLTAYAHAQIGVGTTTPNSTLDVRGSMATKYTAFSANTTAGASDNMLVFTGTAAATLTLPDATACQGRIYWIKNTSSNASTLTIATTSSQTIDGLTTWPLSQTNKAMRVVSNGANWLVTAEVLPGASAGTPWIYGGNNVTSQQNIGTTSNYSLPFITNNTQKMILTNTGNLGIGTSTFNATYPEKLLVDAGTTSSVNAIVGKGNINSYLQLNIQNSNGGGSASSDVVATADNGSETTNYVDMGINGSGNTSGAMGNANDAYLYNIGQNLLVGTGSASKSLVFMTGGTSQSTNERMRIDGSGNVGIGIANPAYKLSVNGTNPLFLTGVQTGANTDSVVTIVNGVVRKLHPSALASSNNSWSILGNAGTNPSTNFLGTTDNQALVIKQNSTQVGRFDANSIALGITATTNNSTHSYVMGSGANTAWNISNALALGTNATVNSANGIVIGNGASTAFSLSNPIAIGSSTLVNGNNGVALGNDAGVDWVANGTALGANTLVSGANSTAVGYNTIVNSANALILGDMTNANLSVGIGSETFSGTNREKLLVDAGVSGGTAYQNVIVGKGNTNSYAQLNIQNANAGTNASADVVATANNGNESINYIDMGINSGSNTTTGVLGGANTAYLYTTGNDFAIGNGTNSRNLNFFTTTAGTYTERMRITSAGNIGIANTAPTEKLDVTGNVRFSGALMPNNLAGAAGDVLVSSGAGVAPTWQSANGYIANNAWMQDGNTYTAIKKFGTISNHDIPFITNNTEKMRLTTGGFLGLGTNNPQGRFHFVSESNEQGDDFITDDYSATTTQGFYIRRSRGSVASPANCQNGDLISYFRFVPRYNGALNFVDGSGLDSYYKGNGTTNYTDMRFFTSNAEAMRIDENGSVGIGATAFSATNPEQLLVDAGTSGTNLYQNVIVGKGNTNSYAQLNIQNTNAGTAASSDVVATANNGNESVNYIDMGVNSGSNTSTGVLGGANTAYLYSTGSDFVIGNSTNAKDISIYTTSGGTPSEKMRILSNGNVGVNTAAPVSTMDVNGSTSTAILVTATNVTLDATHSTVIIAPTVSATVTLPAASSATRRIYTIVNQNLGGRTIGTYKNFTNGNSTTVGGYSSITVQSDGTNWYQIR